MPDTSPGLPPVGELVQITHRDGLSLLGVYERDGGFLLVGQRPDGFRSWCPGSEVVSWCRVLVIPDSDEIRTTLETVIAEHVFGIDYPVDEAGCCAEAMTAALREAAIR